MPQQQNQRCSLVSLAHLRNHLGITGREGNWQGATGFRKRGNVKGEREKTGIRGYGAVRGRQAVVASGATTHEKRMDRGLVVLSFKHILGEHFLVGYSGR
jgi:hypothetical protein